MAPSIDAQAPDDHSQPLRWWDLGWWNGAIFGIALGLRLVYLFELRGSPMVEVLVGDSRGYSEWAERLAAGDWLGSEVFYQAPLYPYLIGVLYSVFGANAMAIRLAQAVLGALSCVFLSQSASRFFDRKTGIVAGLLLAAFAPAIYYDGLIQKASVAVFFLTLSLFFLSLYLSRPKMHFAALVGISIGLLILTRENAIILIPALALTFLLGPKVALPQRVGALALFALGLAAALLPVAFRNSHVGGGFHLTTSQMGTNLYIGNNEKTDGRYQPLRQGRGDPRFERIDATELAEAGAGRSLTPAEVSQYWVDQTLEYIRENPGDWIVLIGRKILLTWNATEVNDAEDLYTYADHSLLLRATSIVLHFGVLAPLAFVGLCATWSRRRELWPLYFLLASYMASVVIFYVFGRYRYPMVPFLALFAAAGIAQFQTVFFGGDRRKAAITGLGAALLLIVCNLPVLSKDEMRSTTYSSLGSVFSQNGDYDRAIELQAKSLEYNPNSSATQFNLANALARGQRPSEAIEHYQRAIELDPGYAGAHTNLANVYRDLGRIDEAIETYTQAITADPGSLDAYNNLGTTFAMQQRYAEAIVCYQQALRIAPDFDAARMNLERALDQQRRYQATPPN